MCFIYNEIRFTKEVDLSHWFDQRLSKMKICTKKRDFELESVCVGGGGGRGVELSLYQQIGEVY